MWREGFFADRDAITAWRQSGLFSEHASEMRGIGQAHRMAYFHDG
jgi:hypothetical protein